VQYGIVRQHIAVTFYPLRFDGRKRVNNADKLMSAMDAKLLVEHGPLGLGRDEGPPMRAAAVPRGHEGRRCCTDVAADSITGTDMPEFRLPPRSGSEVDKSVGSRARRPWRLGRFLSSVRRISGAYLPFLQNDCAAIGRAAEELKPEFRHHF
jgi:hypothetical protein